MAARVLLPELDLSTGSPWSWGGLTEVHRVLMEMLRDRVPVCLMVVW